MFTISFYLISGIILNLLLIVSLTLVALFLVYFIRSKIKLNKINKEFQSYYQDREEN